MKRTLLIILISAMAIAAQAQNTGNTAGGIAYEYSIGDVMYGKVVSSSTMAVMQSELVPAKKNMGKYLPQTIAGFEMYPSPVDDILYMQPSMGKRSSLEYVMFDGEGKVVRKGSAPLETGSERQSVDMGDLALGQYTMLIKWHEGTNTLVNAYRIQKLR